MKWRPNFPTLRDLKDCGDLQDNIAARIDDLLGQMPSEQVTTVLFEACNRHGVKMPTEPFWSTPLKDKQAEGK